MHILQSSNNIKKAPISAPTSSFGTKGIHNQQQYGGSNQVISSQLISTNLKEYKNLFEEESLQPNKYNGGVGGLNQANYYQDSLDHLLPKKFSQYEEANQNSQRKSYNSGQKDSSSMESLNQPINKYQNQAQEYGRTNSRQSYKRDTLAANADRILQQDYTSNYNRNSNQLLDRPFSNFNDNLTSKGGFTNQYTDNFQNQNSMNNNYYQAPQTQQQKPPLYSQDRIENQPMKGRDQYNKSPILMQQNNLGQPLKSANIPYQQNNYNENQGIRQKESSPVNNVSKQRKYQELYGNSILHQDNGDKQRVDAQENQQSGNQVTIPRQRGATNPPADNLYKQHYEERNQGLLDILFLKRRFADHKIINDTTGIPGAGQYKQALFNRLVSTKIILVKKYNLSFLFIINLFERF